MKKLDMRAGWLRIRDGQKFDRSRTRAVCIDGDRLVLFLGVELRAAVGLQRSMGTTSRLLASCWCR